MYLLTVLRSRPNSLPMALNEGPLSLRALTASQRPLIDGVSSNSGIKNLPVGKVYIPQPKAASLKACFAAWPEPEPNYFGESIAWQVR